MKVICFSFHFTSLENLLPISIKFKCSSVVNRNFYIIKTLPVVMIADIMAAGDQVGW